MKLMKRLIPIAAFWYLIGAFIAANITLSEWPEGLRWTIAGLFVFTVVAFESAKWLEE